MHKLTKDSNIFMGEKQKVLYLLSGVLFDISERNACAVRGV